MKKTRTLWASGLLASLLVLAGCSVAPVYEKPAANVPEHYRNAALPEQWKAAEPAESLARGSWWRVFNDAALDELQARAVAANQDLKAASARLAQARALRLNARSGLFPTVDAGVGATRQRPSAASQGLPDGAAVDPRTLYRAQLGVSYEVDLFGRVASSVDAATADAEQAEALFQSVQLALQADVAQLYFQIREQDAERQLYEGTVALRDRTLNLVSTRYKEGDVSELEVAQVSTEKSAAESELLAITRQRAISEHALAVLLGTTPAEFSMPAAPLNRVAVAVPAGLPSSLLERRPDIAAAERAMAAANARVGVARSAFFPRLNLTGALGYESGELGNLFEWSSRTFLLGPLVGTALSLPLFDGGARQAGVDRARAVYEEDVASYRQTVLQAFREVEDSLASLRYLDEQTRAQDEAVRASARAAHLAQVQYREGEVGLLNVIDADRSVLLQRRIATQLDGGRARAAVSLIRALGGGWQRQDG